MGLPLIVQRRGAAHQHDECEQRQDRLHERCIAGEGTHREHHSQQAALQHRSPPVLCRPKPGRRAQKKARGTATQRARGDGCREQMALTQPGDGALNGTAVIVHGKGFVFVAYFHGSLQHACGSNAKCVTHAVDRFESQRGRRGVQGCRPHHIAANTGRSGCDGDELERHL